MRQSPDRQFPDIVNVGKPATHNEFRFNAIAWTCSFIYYDFLLSPFAPSGSCLPNGERLMNHPGIEPGTT